MENQEIENCEMPDKGVEQLNNVNSYNKQYEMYTRGLEAAVEQYKQMYPEKYAKSQSIGEDMMNKNYELISGEDMKGDLLKCKSILLSVLQYGLELSDLYDDEIELIKKIMTCVLNISKDIKDIIVNIETLESVINEITNKLDEYEKYN
jgi:hypothetical protein